MKSNLLFTLLIAIMIMFSGTSYAQTEKGNWLVGGGLNFGYSSAESTSSISTSESSNISYTLFPTAGYFIADNLVVGTAMSVSGNRHEFDDDDDRVGRGSSWEVGPFARYYLDNNIFFSGRLGYGRSSQKTDVTIGTVESDSDIFTYSLAAGYAFFFNESISLEPQLSYTRISHNSEFEGSDTEYNSGSILFSVGFNIYLSGKAN